MGLHVADRGDNEHLRPLWEAKSFDFEDACRRFGRNNAFWALCYRRHLAGIDLPGEKERHRIVSAANRATAGLDVTGEEDRFTRYEALETVNQVSSYPSPGIRPMAERLRHWARSSQSKRATHPVRRLALAMADIAERTGRERFTASTRQIGQMAKMSHVSVSRHMHVLVDAGLVYREGYCKPYGSNTRGTAKFSIKPRRPAQRIDEVEPPRYDKLKARWTWRRPELRGKTTQWAWLQDVVGSVPNVTTLSSSTTTVACMTSSEDGSTSSKTRGSPLYASVFTELYG